MSAPQLSVRLSSQLNNQLNAYIERTGISKTDVVANALASYLGCESNLSLNQRMVHLEAKIAALEIEVRER